MPKLLEASFKQKKFVHEYLKHGVAKRAAQAAYGMKSGKYATIFGGRTLHHPLVKQYMQQVMDKAGVSDEKLAEKIKLIIDAGTNEVALKQANPAHALRAVELAARLKDIFPAEKKEIQSKSATLNVSLQGKTDDELKTILDSLLEETRDFKRLIEKTPNSLQPSDGLQPNQPIQNEV